MKEEDEKLDSIAQDVIDMTNDISYIRKTVHEIIEKLTPLCEEYKRLYPSID